MGVNTVRNRRPRLVPLAGLAVVAVTAALTACTPSTKNAAADAACTGETEAMVWVSPEKMDMMGQMAKDYNAAKRNVQGRCGKIRIAIAGGEVVSALSCGWDPKLHGADRPDAWTTAARIMLKNISNRHDEECASTPKLIGDPEKAVSVAKTPLVFALPRPMAEAIGWPNAKLSWKELLGLALDPAGWAAKGHPEWGPFTLGRTSAYYSTSGMHLTLATVFAKTDKLPELTPADFHDPATTPYLRQVEDAVKHYGEHTLIFLRKLYDAGLSGSSTGLDYVSALAVEEKSVVDFNRGQPEGAVAGAPTPKPPKVPLAAMYPSDGTLVSDNPYVVVDWPDADPVKKAVSKDYGDFVRDPKQQDSAVLNSGFRTIDLKAGPAHTKENGLIPDTFKELSTPAGPAVGEMYKSWKEFRKRANLLVAVDASAQMADAATSTNGQTKLEQAKFGAINPDALRQFAPEDKISLWSFGTAAGGGSPWQPVVASGPVSSNLKTYQDAVQKLGPQQQSSLYATIRAAHQEVKKNYDPAKSNAIVVFTRGKNDFQQDNDLQKLISDLQAANATQPVRVVPIAFGEDADLELLNKIAKATGSQAFDSRVPRSLEKAFSYIVSNY